MSQPNFKVIGTNATGKSKVYPRNGGTLSKKEAQRLSSKLLVRSPMDITDTSFDVVSVEVVEIIMRQSLEQQSTIKELT